MTEPHWASVEDSEPLSNGPNSNYGSVTPLKMKSPCAFWSIKIITMILSTLMFGTALYGLYSLSDMLSVGKIFVAVYMLFFSALLFLFELVQISPWPSMDLMFQRNFGFLYSPKGKAFYIIL